MKWKRVNILKAEEEQISSYFTKAYHYKAKPQEIIKDYKECRENEKDPEYKQLDSATKKLVDEGFATKAWHFYLNLIIGVKEVASYLAESFFDGFGTVKNDFLAYLTLAIGSKLGDSKSLEFATNKQIPNNAKILADKCLVEIRKNEAEVKNRDVSWEEMVARAKAFDYFVKKNGGGSYYDSIKDDGAGMRLFCKCVEPIIEDNYNYAPSHTTTATYSGVPPMGQTPPPAKEGCEIS